MQPIKIEEVASLPIPLAIKWKDGTEETINLPRLSVEDFMPMLAEETQKRKDAGRKAIQKAGITKPNDKWLAERQIELDEATIPDLSIRVQNPKGIKFVVATSMEKAGIAPEKREAIWRMIPSYLQHTLSGELSTLFAPLPSLEPKADEQKGGAGTKPDPFASQSSESSNIAGEAISSAT